MPTETIRSREEVEDLVRGLTLYGTGGGGTPEQARGFLFPHVDAGRELRWVDISEVGEDSLVCCTFGMGSIAPRTVSTTEQRAVLGYGNLTVEQPFADAVRDLEEMTGRRVEALVSFELGAGNTGGPLDASVRLGLPLVDGDLAGRAIPKLTQTTAAIAGIDVCPVAICDSWGNRLFFRAAHSLAVAERVGKMISQVTHLPGLPTTCAHAGFLMTGRTLRTVAIPGTISKSLKVGRAIREAREAGRDPIEAAGAAVGGWVLFVGVVKGKPWENRDGYMFGETLIDGIEGFASHRLRVWYQNENHIAWLDDEPHVTSPDLIMILDRTTGEPFTNTHLEVGSTVGVLAAGAHSLLRSPKALAVLGPAHFGFDFPYVPVEERLGPRGRAR